MSIVELKNLIINSKFTCYFAKKPVLKQKGPYKISIDRIDNSKPHTYENCQVVQLRFQGNFAWDDVIFNKLFKDHNEFQRELELKNSVDWHLYA